MRKKPCKRHKPKSDTLSYIAHMMWMEDMTEKGEEATQCAICGRWYFKEEF